MVNESARIAEVLRRNMEGDAWHGPAVLELLRDVTAVQAVAHPVPGAHSIWELTLHLGGAYRLVLRRLRGDTTPLSAGEDWPPVPEPSEENWKAAVAAAREVNEEIRRAVEQFPPARLGELLIAESPYTAWVQFIGLTQHDLYHAGQIALLKRALHPTK